MSESTNQTMADSLIVDQKPILQVEVAAEEEVPGEAGHSPEARAPRTLKSENQMLRRELQLANQLLEALLRYKSHVDAKHVVARDAELEALDREVILLQNQRTSLSEEPKRRRPLRAKKTPPALPEETTPRRTQSMKCAWPGCGYQVSGRSCHVTNTCSGQTDETTSRTHKRRAHRREALRVHVARLRQVVRALHHSGRAREVESRARKGVRVHVGGLSRDAQVRPAEARVVKTNCPFNSEDETRAQDPSAGARGRQEVRVRLAGMSVPVSPLQPLTTADHSLAAD